MSDYLAIAAVTTTLHNILYDALSIFPGTEVTMLRPEKAGNGAQNQARVNLYLYQVTPNAAWRNSDIVIRQHDQAAPTDRGKDTIERHVQIPLNLHYLLSFYGDDSKLEPQRLLGKVVGIIEARPILSPAVIRTALQSHDDLKQSGLDFQVEYIERIKLAPLPLSLEDLSKLWSVFFQVPYALSVAYEASAVLIEPDPFSKIPRVSERNIGVLDREDAQSEYDRRAQDATKI
jgi:hypothetical protein